MVEPAQVSDSSSENSGSENSTSDNSPESRPTATPAGTAGRPRKGPFSFLSGSLTSFGFGWLALQLSSRVVAYYGDHPPHYDARFAQSIAVFMKTLIVGMTFLATFTFAFVGLGLFLTFIRSLLPGWREAEDTA
jgi:Protein of unknown function (DUF3082)